MERLGTLREQHAAGKLALQASLLNPAMQPRSVKGVLRGLSKHTDTTLRAVWKLANMPASASLIAVGGYGRNELFPGSDVDVLVLLTGGKPPEADPQLRQCIEQFISNCWDVGLEIGASVRQPSDCLKEAANDVTVQTSLLESRWLAGSKMALPALMQSVLAALRPIDFFTAKTLEMRQRHQRFDSTPYSLEPNCKESPGGLRDLQVVAWVAKAAGFGSSWDDMAAKGLITDLELGQLKTNEALLSLIRARLHVLSKRREDRLIFDLQNAVAETFGYKGSAPADGHSRSARRASEALMKRYYWAAK